MKNAEQDLCRDCGFCCDGTLFFRAKLKEDELGKFNFETETKNNQVFFKQPCPYFEKTCTIYNNTRPHVCGQFKCRILRRAIRGKTSFNEAQNLINKLKIQKRRLELSIPGYTAQIGIKESWHNFRKINHHQWQKPALIFLRRRQLHHQTHPRF